MMNMETQVEQPVRTAVLLAAGRGNRLRPHTDTVPKPLLIHRGRPTLDYILNSLNEAGIDRIILVTHHLAEQLDAYAKRWSASGRQSVHCVRQQHLFGTADALECVFRKLPEISQETFIMSATDYLVPRRFYSQLMDFHQSHKAAMSISMKRLDPEEIQGRSSIRFADDGAIVEVVEKPQPGQAPSDIAANLAYVLPPTIVSFLEQVQPSQRGEREVQSAITKTVAQLYFYYSAMNAGKSTSLLQSAHNYGEQGMQVLLFTAAIDDRFEQGVIRSRIGLQQNAAMFDEQTDFKKHVSEVLEKQSLSCILVDEAQFLARAQVDELAYVVDLFDVPVLCFGIRTDFQGELFPGSSRLLAIADKLQELKTVCTCGRTDGQVVAAGEQVQIGGNERYESKCRRHYRELVGGAM